MDNLYNVKRLALVLAVQAEIDGMKARNELQDKAGLSPRYLEIDFSEKAMDLRNLAYANDDQL